MVTSHGDAAQDAASTSPTDAGPADAPLVCGSCGRVTSHAEAVLSWSRGTDRGRTTWTCGSCSRDNVRSIESKLDPAWW